MKNLVQYIGIPFESHGRTLEGMDCLGLVIHFYKQELDLELPDIASGYDDAYAKAQVQDCVLEHKGFDWCREVDKTDLQPYDVLCFVIGGYERHVGVYLGNGEMLHLIHGCHSVIESINSFKWKNRLARVYRHVTM